MAETESKFASHQGDGDSEADKRQHHRRPRHADIPLPPKGFIPLKASEEERLYYGFPARPNPATHPKQHEVWERTLGMPMQIQHHVPRQRAELQFLGKASDTAPKPMFQPLPSGPGTYYWDTAASVYQSFPGCTNVTASWNVPRLEPPVNPVDSAPWAISCVVQLDGMLLGGTTSYVTYVDGEIQTGAYAFASFLSSDDQVVSYKIINVDVSQGHQVTCSVCANLSDTYGDCVFSNQTTGEGTSVMVPQPSRIDVLTRISAAWGVSVGSEDGMYSFSKQAPYIGIVSLIDCSASSPTSSLGLEPGEVVSNLNVSADNPGPNPVWETAVLSPSVMWVLDRT